MEERILELFEKRSQWPIKELEKELRLKTGKEFTTFIKTLNKLEDNRILCNDHAKYFLIDQKEYFTGKIKDISRYEYAVVNGKDKIYIPKKAAFKVFDRDEVLVRISDTKKEIVRVYKHEIQYISGEFKKSKKGLLFYSDIDYHCQFKVKNMNAFTIHPKDKAVVAIEKYTDPLEVKIIKVIGKEGEAGNDITTLLYTNQIRLNFSDKIQKEVSKMPSKVMKKDLKDRVDLRNLLTVTIDGDDAKDFDDAISIERHNDGFILYVHIADVSHYVKEGSAIDQEAYARSTSIYVCDRVVPMLPFELSNGICSLNPEEDRCTLTCKMYIDEHGNCTSYQIMPTLIHSNRRCTYNKVNLVLKNDPDVMDEYKEILNLIYTLEDCATLLKKQAVTRGNIDFESKEAIIQLDKKGIPVSIEEKKRGFAEEMIEQCMILANVCVAHELHTKELPCMYRVHETPDPEKVATICSIARVLDVPCEIYPEDVTTQDIQQFLSNVEDEHKKEILSMVSLRSMQKARYDQECLGHFGLSLSEYCHFTSPIRRYSDLVVHRMLRKYLFEQHELKTVKRDMSKIEKQSFHVSQKERDAIYVERLVDDYKKAQYMSKRIGQKFKGTIVGVMNFGFFVELDNTVEGLVPVRSLMDYFEYDEEKMCLIGETSKKTFTLGQSVKVECVDVNQSKGQIEFALYSKW